MSFLSVAALWLLHVPLAGAQTCDPEFADACVDPTADVHATATVAEGAYVGAYATVGADVAVGHATVASRATMLGSSAPGVVSIVDDGAVIGRRSRIGHDATVGPDVVVSRAVQVGDELIARAGAGVGYASVLGDRVTLEMNSVVGALTEIGDDSVIDGVVARGVVVGRGARIEGVVGPQSVVGAGAVVSGRVRKEATIGADAQVPPGARVGRGAYVGYGVTLGEDSVVGANGGIPDCAVVHDDIQVPRGQTLDVTALRADCVPGQPGHARVHNTLVPVTSVAPGVDGSLYLAGKAYDSAGGNRWEARVKKLSPTGEVLWEFTAGGPENDYVTDVSVYGDSVYVVARSSGDFQWPGGPVIPAPEGRRSAHVARLSAVDGTVLWSAHADYAGSPEAYAVSADADGAYVAGSIRRETAFGDLTAPASEFGTSDAFVARIDASGQWQWVRKAGGAGQDQATSLDQDEDGNAVVGWTMGNTTYFDWTNGEPTGRDFTTALEYAPYSAVVSVVDRNGDDVQTEQFVIPGGAMVDRLSPTADGYVMVGRYWGDVSLGTHALTGRGFFAPFVARLDSALQPIGWSAVDADVGGVLDDGLHAWVGRDQTVITGSFRGPMTYDGNTHPGSDQGGPSLFIASLDNATGGWNWWRFVSEQPPSGHGSSGTAIGGLRAGGEDHIWVAGSWSGTRGTPNVSASFQYFVAHLDADGVW